MLRMTIPKLRHLSNQESINGNIDVYPAYRRHFTLKLLLPENLTDHSMMATSEPC